MKKMMISVLTVIIFMGCSPNLRPRIDPTGLFPAPLPENWTIQATTDSKQYSPLEVLTGTLAQITLTNEKIMLKRKMGKERILEYHPDIVLKVFPKSRLEEIKQASIDRGLSSLFPPIIFGTTEKYVYVTSPGEINNGDYTQEAVEVIEELENSLKEFVDFNADNIR